MKNKSMVSIAFRVVQLLKFVFYLYYHGNTTLDNIIITFKYLKDNGPSIFVIEFVEKKQNKCNQMYDF